MSNFERRGPDPRWLLGAFEIFSRQDCCHDVQRNPNNDDQWLRHTTFDDEDLIGQRIPACELVSYAEEHLATLEAMGAFAVPRHQHIVTEVSLYGRLEPTAYTVCAHVEGRSMETGPYSPEELLALDQLGRCLDEHYARALKEYHPFVHDDLVWLRQYVYGTQRGEEKPRLYLVDIDPWLIPADKTDERWHRRQDVLAEWRQQLPQWAKVNVIATIVGHGVVTGSVAE